MADTAPLLRQVARIARVASPSASHLASAASLAASLTPLSDAPDLFIAGDSSGGGTATSALLAQASPPNLAHLTAAPAPT